MKNKFIKNEIMLRIRNVNLMYKLQEMYDLSHYKSVNEFLNALLESVAFKELNDEEILSIVDNIVSCDNAIWKKVKDLDIRTMFK